MSRPSPAVALVLAAAALAGVGLGACGDEDESSTGSDLAALVPSEVPVYAEAVVRPEGEQREAVERALGTLLRTDDPGGMIVDALDEELAAGQAR